MAISEACEQIAFTKLVRDVIQELRANLPVLLRRDHPQSSP